MKDFMGKIAVITGGGAGMGRELARQLAAEGCQVAMCDVSAETMDGTRKLCGSARISTFVADVSIEAQVTAFAAAVSREVDHIDLLFNNAGIGGGGSFVAGDRALWDKTFAVCWGGVYHTTRAFLPLLMKAREGHIVNTSSVNGFWASIGRSRPHTAYSAAKFAVKGFTEALMTDLAVNAPHIKASVVMPGHIGTEIVRNTFAMLNGGEFDAETRARADAFRDNAPTTAAEAARIILDGVKAERWRILVGKDAAFIDRQVREQPENAYSPDFYAALVEGAGWRL